MIILFFCAWFVLAFFVGWALGSYMKMRDYDELIQAFYIHPGDYDEY